MSGSPIFSVIVPDYGPAVSATRRELCIQSLRQSTWRDFEVIWLHDGPAEATLVEQLKSLASHDNRFSFVQTPERHNDWGHSLRDVGLERARGRYIIHLNADNVLYPQAMSTLQAYSQRPLQRLKVPVEGGTKALHRINPEVLIFAIRLMGCINAFSGSGHLRQRGQEAEHQLILPGWPPRPYWIDAMQLVTTREIWRANGGWHDKSETSDGKLLAQIAKHHGYCVIPEILGEHW